MRRTNLSLDIDSQKAALLGVPAVEFDRAVRLAVAGIPAGRFKDTDGEQYDIMVRTPIDARPDVRALDQVRVATLSGETLPLSQLARVEFSSAPTEIHRYNRERAVTIDADVKSGYNTDRVTKAVLQRLDQMEWPRGYSYVPGGELETRTESFGGLQSALIIALLGIVAILVLEFGNFKSTLIVLTVVPFGIAGGILMLGLTGNTISFTATIGFIALIGIETKNSILLVDFTNRLRAEGVPLDEAIERAGEVRFLPILLTSATAIGGLLPLALQNSAMYSPLAWVIIGGLLSSTFVARIVTPAIYKLIPPAIEVDAALARSGAPRRSRCPSPADPARFLEPPLALRRARRRAFFLLPCRCLDVGVGSFLPAQYDLTVTKGSFRGGIVIGRVMAIGGIGLAATLVAHAAEPAQEFDVVVERYVAEASAQQSRAAGRDTGSGQGNPGAGGRARPLLSRGFAAGPLLASRTADASSRSRSARR